MQTFMVKKGLIDKSMTMEEMQQFITEQENQEQAPEPPSLDKAPKHKATDAKRNENHSKTNFCCNSSTSEVTIYKRAVQQLAPYLEERIDQFVTETRKEVEVSNQRKVSSS